MPPSFPGRRSFLAAAAVLILFGSVHLLAVYSAHLVPPESPADVALDRALREHRIDLGRFQPTAWGLLQVLNASYSVLLLHLGILDLMVARAAAAHGVLRRLTLVNLVGTALLLSFIVLARFPPPALFAAPAVVLFAVSWWRQRRS